jgi:hypothetical protein
MSFFSGIYVKTNQLDAVASVIKDLTGLPITQRKSFPKNFGASFGGYFSSIVSLGLLQPDWITIRYNGGCDAEVWTSILSEDFDTQALAVLGESVSSYYELILYDKWQKIRHIRDVSDDDSLSFSWGEKLAFENEDTSLNSTVIEDFCANLGLIVFLNYAEHQWITLCREELLPLETPKQGFWEKVVQFFSNIK